MIGKLDGHQIWKASAPRESRGWRPWPRLVGRYGLLALKTRLKRGRGFLRYEVTRCGKCCSDKAQGKQEAQMLGGPVELAALLTSWLRDMGMMGDWERHSGSGDRVNEAQLRPIAPHPTRPYMCHAWMAIRKNQCRDWSPAIHDGRNVRVATLAARARAANEVEPVCRKAYLARLLG